jgi:Fe-S oxidoreductase
MNEPQILVYIQSCKHCQVCLDYCDTFEVTQDKLKSPEGRLQIAEKVFNEELIGNEERIDLYTCTLCGICDKYCESDIPISEIIHSTKIKLVEQKKAPLEIHKKIIQGILDTVDPLAGSYYVEWLTNKMEEEAENYFNRIEEFGGVIPAIKANFFQKEIANASYRYQKEIEARERIIVGVNDFKLREPCSTPLLKIDEEVAQQQIERLNKIKKERDNEKVREKLIKLREAAKGTENLMPFIIDAVREYASIGEIISTLKEVFGTYIEDSIY